MFTLRYGNDQTRLFNSNCQCINLLQHIRSVCNLQHIPQGELDLADETTGYLQFLKDSPLEYANTLIKPRSTYVPIHVKVNEDNSVVTVPLLETSGTAKQPFVLKTQKQPPRGDRALTNSGSNDKVGNVQPTNTTSSNFLSTSSASINAQQSPSNRNSSSKKSTTPKRTPSADAQQT
eukprot:TRINITY_DN25984_c0_g1_i1.p1 TRINITY_DN25984_c0_g1~~TRINITY_DN25984_c0_g1_i1.p1  ORF type:complete len:177 (-),score=16.47 TRINITY_DN25984_c0_g1_i1:34-564(-)